MRNEFVRKSKSRAALEGDLKILKQFTELLEYQEEFPKMTWKEGRALEPLLAFFGGAWGSCSAYATHQTSRQNSSSQCSERVGNSTAASA